MIYLDNSATTKPCQQSINRINDALCENWGNPSSLYELGLNSELILDDTRKSVAKLIGCSLPILAKKIGFDPAVMASPLITTLVDALSLLVYCAVATAVLGL